MSGHTIKDGRALTGLARVQRNPIVYHVASPPREIPYLWVAFCSKTGRMIAHGYTRRGCIKQVEHLGYEASVFLRSGDRGSPRLSALLRWARHRCAAKAGAS